MISKTLFRYRLPIIVASVVAATAVFASAAANTVPFTAGGEGEHDISGYTTTNVHYTLNSSDQKNIDNVSFNLTPDTDGAPNPTIVKVKLVAEGSYYDAVLSGAAGNVSTWVATPTLTMPVDQVDLLTVIATQ